MVAEVLDHLIRDPAGVYADLTVGGGGHAEAILEHTAPAGRLIGVDRDPEAAARARARLARFGARAAVEVGRAGDLPELLAARGMGPMDGVLLDLGLSSDQLAGGRGFSFEGDAPLDMRFDAGEPRERAADLLARLSAGELAALFQRYGDFPPRDARRVASRLTSFRRHTPLDRVSDLRTALTPLFSPPARAQNLARIFQSLRIAVNDELDELDRALDAAATALRPGGVLCVLSYHSLEDRRTKAFFAPKAPPRRDLPPPPGWRAGRMRPLTRRALRPQAAEIAVNPRARSARLRAGVRTEER
jgi:16S rRNA (cytosine1402-N4)-methyltransferase